MGGSLVVRTWEWRSRNAEGRGESAFANAAGYFPKGWDQLLLSLAVLVSLIALSLTVITFPQSFLLWW